MFKKSILKFCIVVVASLCLCSIGYTAETKAPASPSGAGTDLIDLNFATKQQLMSLPGITEELAKKIVENRPYIDKTELRRKNILPLPVFYDNLDKITIDEKKRQMLEKSKKQTKLPEKPIEGEKKKR